MGILFVKTPFVYWEMECYTNVALLLASHSTIIPHANINTCPLPAGLLGYVVRANKWCTRDIHNRILIRVCLSRVLENKGIWKYYTGIAFWFAQHSTTEHANVNTCPIAVPPLGCSECRLIQVPLGVYRVFQTFFWPAEFPGYHQCQQESQ